MALNLVESSDQGGHARRRDRAVVHGAAASILIRGVVAGTSLLTIAIMARSLSEAELGFVLTVVSIWMLVSATTDLGIGPVLSARVADAHGRDDLTDMRAQVRVALAFLCGLALLVAAAGSTAAYVLPWSSWIGGGALPDSTVAPALLIAFVAAALMLLGVVGTSVLAGVQRQAKAQARLVVGSVGAVFASALAAWVGASPWVFVLAVIGPPAVAGLFYTWRVVWFEYPHLRPGRPTSSPHEYRGLLTASGYMAMARVSDGIIGGTGVIVVAAMEGPAAAAEFGVVSRIFMLLSSVLQTAGSQVWPAMTESLARGDVRWVGSRYRLGVALIAGVSLVGATALCLAGPFLTRVFAGPEFQPPFLLFVALAAMAVISSINSQMMYLIGAIQAYRPIAIVFACASPVALVLAVILTTTVGVAGPALAAALAYGVVVSPRIFVLTRRTLRSLATKDE